MIAHDTIPVRWAEPRWQRPLQRAFYSWSARGADRVIVYSKSTAGAVVRDLRVRKSQLRLVRLPIDLGMAARAIDRRRFEARGPGDVLYVGIDRPHKNLRRAILAFNGSSPHRAGRRFLLVGLQPDRVFAIREMADRCGVQGVVPMGRCSDAELEGHLAGASVAVQPALEEGLGLTVIEGLAAGLRVCCPRGTAQEEAALGFADLFDGTSVASMRQAIDRAWNAGWRSGAEVKAYLEAAQIPKPIEFASAIVAVLDEVQ